MIWKEILIRYGELSTKGKNKMDFIRRLRENIRYSTADLGHLTIRTEHDRMFIALDNEEMKDELVDRLKHVFGIQSFSPVAACEKDIEVIKQLAKDVMKQYEDETYTFKVEVKRTDKKFPLESHAIQRVIGATVLSTYQNLKVQMRKPQIEMRIEVRMDAVYIMAQVIQGAGGMPTGSNGRSVLMLSGGIDSPVAGYLMMKRGVRLDAVHFFSPPYTSDNSLEKVKDLAKELTKFGAKVRLHVIPFTEIQLQIKEDVPENMSMTATRRMMLRAVDKVREDINALAIVTGESLGQVASQTLDSLTAINDVTNTPILRPLIAYDKLDIINIAEKIGTYETSIRPYEDCCTIFTPANPKTKPKVEKVVHYEERTNYEELIERAVTNREVYVYPEKKKAEDKFADLL